MQTMAGRRNSQQEEGLAPAAAAANSLGSSPVSGDQREEAHPECAARLPSPNTGMGLAVSAISASTCSPNTVTRIPPATLTMR
ncbi:hypothetical protein [Erythrobacter sp. QSSC1-22B]|uniref:hypothetical protein n=1 Tax=Erythrobacter sp. QSSC1-22B TaxID=1860125 RepID=UPI00119D1C0F|nr:hypothetical protein [Erythrobacter sp. QSSC1-22B]